MGATISSIPGAVLFDDFDSIQNTAIGTITGGVLNVGSAPATGIFTGNFIATGSDFDVITVTLTNPASYVGFIWGTPDPTNEVDVYNGATLLGSFSGFALLWNYFDIPPSWSCTTVLVALRLTTIRRSPSVVSPAPSPVLACPVAKESFLALIGSVLSFAIAIGVGVALNPEALKIWATPHS
jgi:hypothetical protein